MVRRVAVVSALVLLVTGCSLKEALSGHQDVVATAAGHELTVERVASMLAPAKAVPLRREVIDRIAEMWVDYQLLAQASARGDSLMDSATVMAANWPLVMQTLANEYHDSVVGEAHPTPAQVDSAYNGNDYRYISHILVAVRGDTTDAVKNAKRRQAEQYLQQVRGGANFAQLANRVSDDPGSKENGGSVGLMGRGVMVKAFEDAAFALQPGEFSREPVQTAFGYHILWRPPLAAVRDSFTADLANIMMGRRDSVFLDSLANKTGISVRSRAPAIVRSAAQNVRLSEGRSRTLATWRGGRLTEGQFATWLQAFPMQTRAAIGQAPDSTLMEFVKNISRNQQIIDAARARHLQIPPADYDSIRAHYRSELHDVLTAIGVTPDSLAADSTSGTASKGDIAARRVDAYFTSITNSPGTRAYYEVPPYLGGLLRDHGSWKINQAGVDRALDRARELRGPETPAGQAPGRMQPAPIQPSPGGPPVAGPPTRSIR